MSNTADGAARKSIDADPPMRDFSHSLPMALMRAREAVMGEFRPLLRSYGLTEQQWRVLRVLIEADSVEATELAKRSFILLPSLSRILKTLDARGLIRREPVAHDQRRSAIAVTDAGRALFAEIAPQSEQRYRELAARFGQQRLDELYALLESLQQAARS